MKNDSRGRHFMRAGDKWARSFLHARYSMRTSYEIQLRKLNNSSLGTFRKDLLRVYSSFTAALPSSPKITTMAAGLLIAAILVVRNQGLHPVVMADEYIYSTASRLSLLSDAKIPSYIYFFVYRYTNYCYDGFLECARLLNVMFFILAAPVIYVVATQFISRRKAVFVSVLSILLPMNTYTAYFMPESLYFFAFWIFSWSLLRITHSSKSYEWIGAAILFSVASLIKPHALFFLPALLLYFAYLIRQNADKAWVTKWLFSSTLFLCVAIGTKFVIGFIFARKQGITFFGPFYGEFASSIPRGDTYYIELAKLTGMSLAGHLLALSVLYSTVFAALLCNLGKVLSRDEASNTTLKLSVYTALMLSVVIGVVALFTASAALAFPDQHPFRLHLRYYNFAFPLLFLVAAAHFESAKQDEPGITWLALPIALGLLYAAITRLAPYQPSLIDNPELRAITYNKMVFYVLILIGILSLVGWRYRRRIGIWMFLFVFVPISTCFGFYISSHELRDRMNVDVFDNAGIISKQYLGKDASSIVVMGSDIAGLFKTLFYIDDLKASLVSIPPGSPADLTKIPKSTDWLVLIGDHDPPPKPYHKVFLNGFALFRIAHSNQVDFTKRSWPGILWRASGLSHVESFGRWSIGPMVRLEFEHPLPRQFTLHLRAKAFGPNVGQIVKIQIGTESADFRLTASMEDIVIPFRNTNLATSVVVSIPYPTSPKELGINVDPRKLGIGFHRLEIEDKTLDTN